MRTPLIRKLVSSALGLVVLGCLWFYFAPVPLGGSTTYVVTHGVSMEPRFHTGDLALVRSQSSYHVGEIVAYDSNMLRTVVLHRIIARDGSRYVFKGDNNKFIDPEHPAASQLIGALWLHVPAVGARLQSLRSPALVGLLVAVAMLLLSGVAFTRRRRDRRRRRRAGESSGSPPGAFPQHTAGLDAGVLALGIVMLLPLLALALLAFSRAPTAHLPFTSPYTQGGALSYSAETPPGPVYPSGRAVTGEPLFTNLINEVDFRYAYLFHAGAAHTLIGKAHLDATIAAPSGWQTTLALGSTTHFHGDRALLAGTLDLTSLSEMLRRVEVMTKVKSSTYTITISPNVSAVGSLNGALLHTKFSPPSQFSFAENEIEPPRATGGTSATGQTPTNPLASTLAGSVTGSQEQTRFFSLGPVRLSVETARAIALGGIAIIVCALAAMLAFVRRRQPRDESAAIRARYSHLIVPVERVSQLPGVAVIDVADMDALARIAEHYDRSILHERTDYGEAFWVTDESGQFRYVVGSSTGTLGEEVVDGGPPAAVTREALTDEFEVRGVVSASEARPAAEAAVIGAATAGNWAAHETDDWAAPAPAAQAVHAGGDSRPAFEVVDATDYEW